MTATAAGHERSERAARHAALGDPVRLAIVDELSASDRAPVELRRRLGLESNLLAHHLDVLERVGLIERSRSSGDGRRRYVHLRWSALDGLTPAPTVAVGPALFVCSANSARSPLAAALWRHRTGLPALSAGTHPADRYHPGAVAAAGRVGLDLDDDGPTSFRGADPRHVDVGRALRGARLDAGHGPSASADPGAPGDVGAERMLVVTVCDQAHEALDPDPSWLHWSVPDPVPVGTPAAFDAVVAELVERIDALAGADAVAAP